MPISAAMQNNPTPHAPINDTNSQNPTSSSPPPSSSAKSEASLSTTNAPWPLSLRTSPTASPQNPASLPSALDHTPKLISQLAHCNYRIVFFLDYDGTLSPIVDDPDAARMPASVRTALSAVASRFTTAIVTGRSKKKVVDMVQLDQLIYAASHGFDIHAPDDSISHRVASDYVPVMKRAAHELRAVSTRFPGTHVEDNFLSISMHYRHLAAPRRAELTAQVDEAAARLGVTRHDGKMVHELRPPHDWHKGKAVNYLLTTLKLNGADVVPIYIGDDVSDESAFVALRGRGLSVIVAEDCIRRPTNADLRLRDPVEVGKFLMNFATHPGLAAAR